MNDVGPTIVHQAVRHGLLGGALFALAVCGLAIGCKEGTGISSRSEAGEPATGDSKPTTATAQMAAAQAARALRAEVQDVLRPYVDADAARTFRGSRVAYERWPTKEERDLAYYRSVKMLVQVARETDLAKGSTLSDLVQSLLSSEYRRRLFDRIIGKSEVTDQEVADSYQKDIAKYRSRGRFWIRHIFLNVVEHPDQKAQKATQARAALADLKAGKPFEMVARQYSDVEGPKGTVLEPLPFGEINPVLEKAITTLKPGEVSDVIETKWGYNVFRLEKIEPPTTKSLESVAGSIRRRLQAQKMREAQARFQTEMERRYPVRERNDALLEEVSATSDAVVVESDFVTITLGEFRKRLLELPPSSPFLSGNPKDRIRFLNAWIDEKRIAYAAVKEGLLRDPELDAISRYFADQTLARVYLEQRLEQRPGPTEEDVRKYYEDNRKRRYTKPSEVRLRELVIRIPISTSMTAYDRYKTWKATQALRDEVVKKLEQGADFVELVKRHSVAPSKEKGGDTGFIVPARRGRAFADAVKDLQVGEISKPVEDLPSRSYTLLRLEARKPGEVIPLDDRLRTQIAEVLRRSKQRTDAIRIRMTLAKRYRKGMTREEIVEILTSQQD